MRLFFAIDFPDEIKREIANPIDTLKKRIKAAWIKTNNMHLTLKFIGETEKNLAASMIDSLKNAFSGIQSFELKTTQTGFFPNARKARVFYLAFEESETLQHCFKVLEEKLVVLDIPPEKRSFKPHITLARIKKPLAPADISQLGDISFPESVIPVNKIVLMQSHLAPAGARYTAVQNFPCA